MKNLQEKWKNDMGEAGEDDRCTMDPAKLCDNCFRCLDENMEDYAKIMIERVILDADGGPDFAPAPYDEAERRIHVHPMTLPGYTGVRRIEEV